MRDRLLYIDYKTRGLCPYTRRAARYGFDLYTRRDSVMPRVNGERNWRLAAVLGERDASIRERRRGTPYRARAPFFAFIKSRPGPMRSATYRIDRPQVHTRARIRARSLSEIPLVHQKFQ